MTGTADKTKVVLPAHRRDHMLRRQIERVVFVPGADQDQGGNSKATAPDGPRRIDFNNFSGALRSIQNYTFARARRPDYPRFKLPTTGKLENK